MKTIQFSSLASEISHATGQVVVTILAVDASSSMDSLRDSVVSALRQQIMRLASQSDVAHLVGVVQFANDLRVVAEPVAAARVVGIDTYSPSGMTAMYRAVKRTLDAMHAVRAVLSSANQNRTAWSLVVLSDGEDNASNEGSRIDYPQALHHNVRIVQALGWQLMAVGVGVNGQELAAKMHFPEALAITVDHDPRGMELATSLLADQSIALGTRLLGRS